MPRDVDGEWQPQESFVLSGMPQVQVWDHQRSGHFLETRGLFVIHAALLHTGKVLCFSGHAERLMYAPVCYVFDPENPSTPMQAIDFPPGADMFCCGLVQLRDGKILAVGGSQHDLVCQMSAADFGQSDPVDRAICTIIDAALPGLTPAQRLETLSHQDAHTFTVYRGSRGSKTIAYFTPEASGRGGRWTKARVSGKDLELAQGRWYPTTVALSDGRVAVFSGRREMTNAATSPGFIAETVEIIDSRASRWTVSTVAIKDSAGNPAPDLPLPTYPGMHLAADGKIFHTFTSWGQEIDSPSTTVSFSLRGSTANGTWTAVTGQAPSQPRREEGMSVLLPPAQDGRILVVGGAFAQNRQAPPRGLLHHTTPAGQNGIANFGRISNTSDPTAAEVLTTSSGSWTNAGTMAFGRVNGHCVLLPDSTVFLCGGHDNYKWRPLPTTPPGAIRGTTPSMTSEIFTPGSSSGTGTFRTADSMIHPPLLPPDPRMYHSVALLLPDGSVFTAGGADPNQREPGISGSVIGTWKGRDYNPAVTPLNAKSYQIYKPPYFFKSQRPILKNVKRGGSVTGRVYYGENFTIGTPQGASIRKVALIRPACVTHHTDTEQRYVALDIVSQNATSVTTTMVANRNLAPPGYYMLWIIDDQNIPCERAKFVHVMGR